MDAFNRNGLVSLARAIAQRHNLDAQLVCALAEQETDWQTWEIRYEPAFEARYLQPLILSLQVTDATEIKARAISWGLLQVMGQDAREFGFEGHLASLCEPENGLEVGCKILAHKLAVNSGNVHDALQTWNGGGNPNYSSEVLARLKNYEA